MEEILKKYGNILGNTKDLSIENIVANIVSYHQNIIGCMPGNVYWLDKNGIAVGCNQNVLEMFGLKSLNEFKDLTFDDMGRIGNWTPEATQSFKEDTLAVIKTGQAKLNKEEPPISHSNGKLIYFLTSRVPLLDHTGAVIGVVGISIDITERKKMEIEIMKAKEKSEIANKVKTQFLENMRHDIRTPLNAMIGFAELLKDIKNDSQIKEYHQFAVGFVESSKELLRFLNEVLESINIASGDIPLLKNKFNLSTVLENVIKLHLPIAIRKNITLNFNFDEKIPPYLIGDPVRIYRIALEILSNALKFTDKGFVTINAKLIKQLNYDLVIMIEIQDSGPGIPPEKQSDLLLRFKKLTPSYEGIYKGTGLGLSIAKQFIDDLEGEIYIESKLNQGAKFICLFPLKKSLLENNDFLDVTSLNNKSAISLVTEENNQPSCNTKVLIVEDHEFTAMIEKNIFMKLGYQADIAFDGETALSMHGKNHYDLVVMDIGLPKMNGYETTEKIRNHQRNTKQLPLIVGLSAHIGIETQKQGLKSGMNLVKEKPLTQEMASQLLKACYQMTAARNQHAS